MRRVLATTTAMTLLLTSAGVVKAQEAEESAISGAFSPAGELTEARTGHVATLLPDGRVIVARGRTEDGGVPSAELWDPSTMSFARADSSAGARAAPRSRLDVGREDHTETLLPDGRTLIVGGSSVEDGTAKVEAEVWDPETLSSVPAGSLAEARSGHSATLLPDGRVLIVGGGGSDDDPAASALTWDPDTASFSPAGALDQARSGHSATFLRDGRVLVVGGHDEVAYLTSAEVWERTEEPPACFGRRPTVFALPGVEIEGTGGADVILGSVGADVIHGLGGGDRICAGDGADVVSGGDGRDLIDGGAGVDELSGGRGDDRLIGRGGGDTIAGGRGDDRCLGGAGVDWLSGCGQVATKGILIVTRDTRLKAPHVGPIVIQANNVTLDCAGHTVTGWRDGEGILLRRVNGVTVKNCGVTNFNIGIRLWASNGNTLTNNRADRNRQTGFRLEYSNKNRLTSNRADGNGLGRDDNKWGFYVSGHRNVLRANSADGNGESNFTTIGRSSRNRFIDNVSVGGRFGFNVGGDRNTFEGNTVTESDWAFLAEDLDNSIIAGNTLVGPGQLFTLGGAGNTITGNAADGGYEDGSPPGANTYADNACSTDPSRSRPCFVRPAE